MCFFPFPPVTSKNNEQKLYWLEKNKLPDYVTLMLSKSRIDKKFFMEMFIFIMIHILSSKDII